MSGYIVQSMLTNCTICVEEPPIENLPNQISGTWHGLPGRECGQCLQHGGLFAGKKAVINSKAKTSKSIHMFACFETHIQNF